MTVVKSVSDGEMVMMSFICSCRKKNRSRDGEMVMMSFICSCRKKNRSLAPHIP
jgi:hypothetical protein